MRGWSIPPRNRDETGGILVENGVIAAIGAQVDARQRAPTMPRSSDCHGGVLAPGLIDMRVQLREPGEEHKETIETGSLAAAAGGVTSMVCLPNTEPIIDDVAGVRIHRPARARDQAREDLLLRRADPGPRGQGPGGDGAAGGQRRARLHRRPQCRARRAGDAPRPHLRAQLRCAGDPASGRAGPRRRRRDEQRRAGDAPRHSRASRPMPK